MLVQGFLLLSSLSPGNLFFLSLFSLWIMQPLLNIQGCWGSHWHLNTMINRTEQLSGWVSTQGRAALFWTLLWFSSLFNLLTHLTLSETSWAWEVPVGTQRTLPYFHKPIHEWQAVFKWSVTAQSQKLISQWPDTWSAQNADHSASKALLIRQKSEGDLEDQRAHSLSLGTSLTLVPEF